MELEKKILKKIKRMRVQLAAGGIAGILLAVACVAVTVVFALTPSFPKFYIPLIAVVLYGIYAYFMMTSSKKCKRAGMEIAFTIKNKEVGSPEAYSYDTRTIRDHAHKGKARYPFLIVIHILYLVFTWSLGIFLVVKGIALKDNNTVTILGAIVLILSIVLLIQLILYSNEYKSRVHDSHVARQERSRAKYEARSAAKSGNASSEETYDEDADAEVDEDILVDAEAAVNADEAPTPEEIPTIQ